MTSIVVIAIMVIGSLAGTALTTFIAASVVKTVFGNC